MGRLRQLANPNALRLRVNRWLRRFDLGLYRPSSVESQGGDRLVHAPVALPPGAETALHAGNPRLAALRARYRGHPAAAHTGWSDLRLEGQLELTWFRGDSQYLYQGRGTPEAAYALSANYVARHDRLGLLDALDEDGAFGALTFEVEGRRVSRDLLDSVLEIGALAAWLGADVEVVATDAVPVSTFLCEYYLAFRGCLRARVVPLDDVHAVFEAGGFDAAVNVHSFGEAPRAAVRWWLERIATAGIPRLLIVHGEPELYALESDLSRSRYDDVLDELGYRRVALRPKYEHSATVQRLGIFPAWYHAFERASR